MKERERKEIKKLESLDDAKIASHNPISPAHDPLFLKLAKVYGISSFRKWSVTNSSTFVESTLNPLATKVLLRD